MVVVEQPSERVLDNDAVWRSSLIQLKDQLETA